MKSLSPRAVLVAYVRRYPTQSAAADTLGITKGYLGDLLHGKREFSDRMLAALGLVMERRIVRVRKG